MFGLFYSITGCCGEVLNVSLHSDGSVLVQVEIPDQSKLLKKLSVIDSIPVSCSLYGAMNYIMRWGVIAKTF